MAFVVPGVCRFAINAVFSGREVVNILDMRIDTTGTGTDRIDAIIDQAKVIIESVTDHLTPVQTNDLTYNSVSWVDLDEDDGSTGETSEGNGAVTWPDAGNITTGPTPSNVAVLVTKETTRLRGHRNGRMYLCGVPEADSNDAAPNDLGGGALTSWQTAVDDFLASINQDGGSPDYDSRLCVVHILTRGPVVPPAELGPPLTGDSRDVEALVVQTRLATQRRRLRG